MSINRRGTERDAFLAAIIAQPDDDVARLVFADWLQENGQDARAQFIRSQVWAAQAEPFSRDARRHATAANHILESVNTGEWVRHLQQRLAGWEYRRGFVEHATVNVATFPHDAEELFAAEPIRSLRLVRFQSAATTVSLLPFFEVPQLERVTRLEFSGLQFSPVELEPVGECPYLQNLTDLSLRGAPVQPNWLGSLITGAAVPALAGLDLNGITNLGPRLADAFPRASHRRFLRLDIGHVRFSSGELKSVLESRCVREVEELRLAWANREGALSHVNPGWVIPWNRLRLLDLGGQKVSDDGLTEITRALARRSGEAPLRWLGLANNDIGADGVRALLGVPQEKLKLYHLDVRNNGLTLSHLAALQSRFPEAVIDA